MAARSYDAPRSGRRGSRPSPLVVTAVTIMLALLPLLAATAVAQDNTTYENVTVEVPQLPEVKPIARPEAFVTADAPNSTMVSLRYTCFYYVNASLCPDLYVKLMVGEQVLYDVGYRVNTTSDCRQNICVYYVHFPLPEPASRVDVYYTLAYPDGAQREYHLVIRPPVEEEGIEAPYVSFFPKILVLAVALGMILSGNLYAVAVGAIVGPLVLYMLSLVGLTPLDFFVINGLILLAIVVFFITRGKS